MQRNAPATRLTADHFWEDLCFVHFYSLPEAFVAYWNCFVASFILRSCIPAAVSCLKRLLQSWWFSSQNIFHDLLKFVVESLPVFLVCGGCGFTWRADPERDQRASGDLFFLKEKLTHTKDNVVCTCSKFCEQYFNALKFQKWSDMKCACQAHLGSAPSTFCLVSAVRWWLVMECNPKSPFIF